MRFTNCYPLVGVFATSAMAAVQLTATPTHFPHMRGVQETGSIYVPHMRDVQEDAEQRTIEHPERNIPMQTLPYDVLPWAHKAPGEQKRDGPSQTPLPVVAEPQAVPGHPSKTAPELVALASDTTLPVGVQPMPVPGYPSHTALGLVASASDTTLPIKNEPVPVPGHPEETAYTMVAEPRNVEAEDRQPGGPLEHAAMPTGTLTVPAGQTVGVWPIRRNGRLITKVVPADYNPATLDGKVIATL
ncbi:hypothetical protein KEM55_005582 [Ascosphaera atra]|nr:hypothetical protein KEM55_005582 [Ascosphaera atra]